MILTRKNGKFHARLEQNNEVKNNEICSNVHSIIIHTNKWIIIRIPFNKCVPVFRGRILDGVEHLSADRIQQLGFLISDKQSGLFKLEIVYIKAYKK
jgi:hypothetical protein